MTVDELLTRLQDFTDGGSSAYGGGGAEVRILTPPDAETAPDGTWTVGGVIAALDERAVYITR